METLSLQQALQRAVQHHRAGELEAAEHLYRAVLEQVEVPDASSVTPEVLATMVLNAWSSATSTV